MSGWVVFNVCFTALLVGAWSAFTFLVFYRADRRMRAAELRGRGTRVRIRGGGRNL